MFHEASWGNKIGGGLIQTLRYADETTLVAWSEQDLGDILNRLGINSQAASLKLKIKKTKLKSAENQMSSTCTSINRQNIKVVREDIHKRAGEDCLRSYTVETNFIESRIRSETTVGAQEEEEVNWFVLIYSQW